MANNSRNETLNGFSYAHVLVEGLDNLEIFKEKRFKERYKKNLKLFSQKYNQDLLAFLILENSAHMIFKFDDIKNLSTCIKSVNLSFSQLYNKSHNRKGVAFKSRFKSEPLKNEKELLNCISYIHSKPVELQKVIFAEQYLYSSANDYALKESEICNLNTIKNIFGKVPTVPNGTSMRFIDSSDEINENFEIVLIELVDRYNIVSTKSLKNDSLLYLICKELKVRTGASLREIAKRLNVNRERVRKLMKINL